MLRLTHPRAAEWLLLVCAVVPMAAATISLLLSLGGSYSVISDMATEELHVREIGHHPVEVGPFSRFGWFHPGPAIYYLNWPFYQLTGHASQTFAIVALLSNAACVLAIALLVRRFLGGAAMIWTLVVLAIYLRTLGGSFLRDGWNPYLPVLPFVLFVLLAWAWVQGSRWSAVAAAVVGSFAVQSHVGFAPPVAAVAAAAIVWRVAIWFRRRGTPASDVRRPAWLPAVVGVVAVVLMWLPPLLQQIHGRPGNLTVLLRYFRSSQGQWGYRQGVREISNSLGALPAYVVGQKPVPGILFPPHYPAWTGILAVVAGLAAVGLAVRVRAWPALGLLVLAGVVGAVGIVSVHQVVGPLFGYLVKWLVAAGLLLWIGIGCAVLAFVQRGPACLRPAARLGQLPRRTILGAAAVVLVLLTALNTADVLSAEPSQMDDEHVVQPLAAAVETWLREHPDDLVRVDFAPTTRAELVGTPFVGAGLVLALQKKGVNVRANPFWHVPFGAYLTADQDRVRWEVVLAFNDGSSPPPAPGQQVIARAGQYQLNAGPAEPIS